MILRPPDHRRTGLVRVHQPESVINIPPAPPDDLFLRHAYKWARDAVHRSTAPLLLMRTLPHRKHWLHRRLVRSIAVALLMVAPAAAVPAAQPAQAAASPFPAFTSPRATGALFEYVQYDYDTSPALADIDNDGDLDVFVGHNNGQISFFENVGDATTPAFLPRTGSANPFDGVDVGRNAKPTLGDIDDDGDLDAFVGATNGTILFFQNTGTATAPTFTQQSAGNNPFYDTASSSYVDVGYDATPALADIDADGDLDMFVGESGGTILFFQNTGTATAPTFTQQNAGDNPFYDTISNSYVDVDRDSTPTFVDIDGDGDLDAFVGQTDGYLYFFRNTGTATAPTFTDASDTTDFFGTDLAYDIVPVFGDLDNDGDVDLIVGEEQGTLAVFENSGSANAPDFGSFRLEDVTAFAYAAPVLVDIDDDGDLDAFIGEEDGYIFFFENVGSPDRAAFRPRTSANNPFDGVDVGDDATPAFVDIDNDGDLDAFVGEEDGNIFFFKNTGSATAPVFTQQAVGNNPFYDTASNSYVDVGGYAAPTFADIDNDGDLDAFVGTRNGTILFFQNTGSASAPTFTQQTAGDNPFYDTTSNSYVDVGDYATPTLVDIDDDGDLDAFVGTGEGRVRFFENQGSATTPTFVDQSTERANPFAGFSVGGYSKPAFADIDADGDLDAFIGQEFSGITFFENTGSATAAAFLPPLYGLGVYDSGGNAEVARERPAFADIDNDGDLDVFIGRDGGSVYFFENIGTASAPAHVQRKSANPFYDSTNSSYIDLGNYATPFLVDVDNDGDVDAFVGNADGDLYFFQNTGTASAPVFTQQTAGDNPFYDTESSSYIDVGNYAVPFLADIDDDGDVDAFVGNEDGTVVFFKNTDIDGSDTTFDGPTFVQQTGGDNPLDGIDVGSYSAPALVDLDRDGDLDALVGERSGTLTLFANSGTAGAATFAAAPNTDNPFAQIQDGGFFGALPSFADIDADGDLDAFVGNFYSYYQSILFLENHTPDVSVAAGTNGSEDGPTNATFTVTLSEPAPTGGLELSYTLSGDATTGADYTLGSGTNTTVTTTTITIAAGETTGTVQVVVNDDSEVESAETVTLSFATSGRYRLSAADSSASVTIADNDVAPTPTPGTGTPTPTPGTGTPTPTPGTGTPTPTPGTGDERGLYLPIIVR